jgi:MarR family transcriptional regulator, organic hydroperoxide resistance regulator
VRYLSKAKVVSVLEATLSNDILMNGRDVMTTIYDFQAELLEGEQKNLAYPQFIVLLALYEQDNVTLTEIGQKTFFDSGTLTPIIKKLEEKQFLKRVAVKEDERMKKVVLLEKALLAKDKIMAIPFELACSLGLDPDDLVAIHQLCQRFLNGLEQPQHDRRDN